MKKLSLIIIGLMACFAIGISTAQGQVFYTVQDLGVVKGMEASEPTAINNLGMATGTAYTGENTCAFLFMKGLMNDAGGVNSRGFGINSANIVVGDAFFTSSGGNILNPSHAAIFTGGGVTDLGVLEGQVYSRANGINAKGWVVGFSGLDRDSNSSRAFIWSRQGGMLDIGTLGGADAQAYAINDVGFVTGTSTTPAMEGGTHAFIYQPFFPGAGPARPLMKDLGTLIGLRGSSYGMAINSNNHVAGYSTINTNDNRVHAFLHNGGKMIDLGSLGLGKTDSDVSVALGINNLDQVVGYSYLPAPGKRMPLQQVAFLWRPNSAGGQMINLNTLLPPSTRQNYLLVSATAINDNGQIVASAYDLQNSVLRAVLLTPQGP